MYSRYSVNSSIYFLMLSKYKNYFYLLVATTILSCSDIQKEPYQKIDAKVTSNVPLKKHLSIYFKSKNQSLLKINIKKEQINIRPMIYDKEGNITLYVINIRIPVEIYDKSNKLMNYLLEGDFFSSYNDRQYYENDLTILREELAEQLVNQINFYIK